MNVEVEITDVIYTQDDIVKRYQKDWDGYTRKKRSEQNISFSDILDARFTMAIATSPEQYAGKIVGHAGIGEYQDLLVDAGTYVLVKEGSFAQKEYNLPNLRGQGIGTKLRNVRNKFAEEINKASRKPFLIVVTAGPNEYTRYLQTKQYVVYDEQIPQWASRKVGEKYYLVYNNYRSMRKAWNIIKGW
tara:strand:- start:427 stop:990 length:564 start_codon:yes stop_codon:yes gene_type:complete